MPSKEELRNEIWTLLSEKGVGAFPFPLKGRIPNFKGSHDAARKLPSLECWKSSHSVKANPDAPQLKARELALTHNKRLFMAVPRLRKPKPFLKIVPGENVKPRKAVSISGSQTYGQPCAVKDLPHIDLIITGSVAAHPDGRRLGKGGGYSDLEFALARQLGKITDETTIVTIVHPFQITDKDIPFESHDIPLDFIVTPKEIIETNTQLERPSGIETDLLSEKYMDEIPVLKALMNAH